MIYLYSYIHRKPPVRGSTLLPPNRFQWPGQPRKERERGRRAIDKNTRNITLDDPPSLTLELAHSQLPKTASVILKTCTASLT